jgi:hypothetical protein
VLAVALLCSVAMAAEEGPSVLEASYRMHYIDVLNTRHEHDEPDQQYTAQHGTAPPHGAALTAHSRNTSLAFVRWRNVFLVLLRCHSLCVVRFNDVPQYHSPE